MALPDGRSGSRTDDPALSVKAPDDRAIMARALGYLFAAGGALAFVALALPSADDVSQFGQIGPLEWASVAATALLTLFLFCAPDRMGLWVYQLILASGTALISAAIYFSGEIASAYVALYVLSALYASYFFSRVAAVCQIAFIGLAYGLVLAVQDVPGNPLARWLTIIGTLVAAGAMVGALRERVERLIVQLRDAARTDVLTNLYNRRGFEELFEAELERAQRAGRPMSLLVGDLDRFKSLNDRFGHKEGDEALQTVSKTLRTHKRKIDIAARIGGEEFAVIVPEAGEHDAYILAERLRLKVRQAFSEHEAGMTISFGVATFPKHGATAEALLISGDQALYAAKELGRDRSVIHNPEIASALATAASRRLAQREAYLATVLALAEALDIRESGTTEHSQRVGDYAEMAARELELPDEAVDRVRIGGVLHDIGTIGVSDSVFAQSGPLEAADWAEVRKHPEVGARMLESATVEDISTWIRSHHERPDGTGYPDGLSGEDIPLQARILAVADAYEAMTADRPYRPKLSAAAARERLLEGVGTQFDGAVVEALLRALDRQARTKTSH